MFDEFRDILTVAEVCVMLRACPAKAYRLIHSGTIPAFRSGRMLLIPKKSVLDYINRNMIANEQEA